MTQSPPLGRLALVGALLVLSGALADPATAGEIVQATDAPRPKAPAESAKCMRLPPGFRVELVASEPLLREPSSVCFDERGRMFVSEIHGYNLDGYLDIVELNKTGELDRLVRRVRHATEASQAEAKKETYGTVRMLRDTDGDGRMDTSDVFADRLPPCYGVVPARGGVIAVGAPDIVYLADRDGDGKAEVRETLFTGLHRELIERGTGNPRWGLDNWIYVAAGGGGGEVTGPKLAKPVLIGHTDYRFKADGSAIEPVTGTEGMFGLTMTDFGDRFHTICTYVAPLPYQYLARNPYVASPPSDVGIVATRKLFPISQPDPWRLARGKDPAWVKFYGATETTPNGYFTASSGQMIYRAADLPEEYRGNYFVCDPANNLIHRELIERRGSEYVARLPDTEPEVEFLASTDQWFRPINLTVGPDGAIYITDMYREIIEDFSAIPRFLQQQYMESLINGKDHGRIWRLSWVGDPKSDEEAKGIAARASSRQAAAKLGEATAEQLVAHLGHANHWWRDTAQRLLVERGGRDAVKLLGDAARTGETPQGRLHALETLSGLGALRTDDVDHALSDPSWGVKVHALPLAEPRFDQPAILAKAIALANDEEPRVRLQAALSLGESRDPQAIDALARLATDHGSERWMAAALASSASKTVEPLLARLLKGEPNAGTLAVLRPLAETLGGQRDDETLGRALEVTSQAQPAAQIALLDGLAVGLARGKPSEMKSERGIRGLEKLLGSPSLDVGQRAARIAGLVELSRSPIMQAAWKSAAQRALDSERPVAARLDAVAVLAVAPWERKEPLKGLLDARHPAAVQIAAVKALSDTDNAAVSSALLENFAGLGPSVQDAIVDALFARQDRLPKLLDAVEKNVVSAVSLSALRREQLVEHGNAVLRDRARKLLASRASSDRAAVIAKYEPALTLPRDAKHGAQVFEKTCSRCHKLAGKGHEIGPDLSASRTRADATLLVDVLDPSSTLSHGFTVYSVTTTAGRVETGLLTSESATSVTLRAAADPAAKAANPVVERVILRKDMEEMRASTKSLMPEGLEKEITPQDLADLLGFLRQALGPAAPPGIVLFDDEPGFLAALVEGGATATLNTSDAFSGKASLRITDGQKHSPRIPGWEFSIVENPTARTAAADQPDKKVGPLRPRFRYLRLAWKSAGAHGVMIELAADGQWPPADKPLRRYYSGRNTSGWKAAEVSPNAPAQWSVVTVDLWKDFGEFTLTGIAPTAMGGEALFDRIELLESLDSPPKPTRTR